METEAIVKRSETQNNLNWSYTLIKEYVEKATELEKKHKASKKTNSYLICLCTGLFFLLAGPDSISYAEELTAYHPPVFFPFVVMGSGIVLVIVSILIQKQVLKRKKKRFNNNKANLELYSRLEEIYSELEKSSLLPETYWSIDAAEKTASYIKNQRADSIKEALNLYEEEKYRKKHIEILSSIRLNQYRYRY